MKTYACSLLETVLKEYKRSTKRLIDDRNGEGEHGWIGLGYYFRTQGESSNSGSTTALGMTKLSWLQVDYSGRLLKRAQSSYDWRTLHPTNGHSTVLDTKMGCLQSCSVLIDGCSVEFTETLIGLGLMLFQSFLSTSNSLVNQRTL